MESESSRQELLEEAIADSLSLSQIRERVKAVQPPTEPPPLATRMETIYKLAKKHHVWENLAKRSRIESLLAQLEELISSEGEEKSLPIKEAMATQNQLPTQLGSELTDEWLNKSLTHTQMLERLGVKSSTLSDAKKRANFSEWSKKQDPDGLAWQWVVESKRFVPLKKLGGSSP